MDAVLAEWVFTVYKHDGEDFGRWPNLFLPSSAGAKSRADA